MIRRLATWVLLIPLSLNGLWMVCENAPQSPEPASAAAQESPAMAHCKTMCPTVRPTQTGSICLVSANGDGRSIAVYAFAVSPPTVGAELLASAGADDFPILPVALYLSPSLPEHSPPPKA